MITAREIAAQYKESELREGLARWIKSAAISMKNTEYYYSIIEEAGKLLGPDAYTCDDGTVSQDVLAAKIVELVQQRVQTIRTITSTLGNCSAFENCRTLEDKISVLMTTVMRQDKQINQIRRCTTDEIVKEILNAPT